MSSREQFEAWAEKNGHDIYRSGNDGAYYFQSTQWSWDIWQAATSAMEAKCAALAADLKAAEKTSEARKQGLIRAHKMFQREKARAEAVEKRLEEVRGYNVDLAEESRQYQQQVDELNDALCQLLPGVQYMDPPDGGSVTPLEQVRRMVTDYRERLKIAESRCDHRSKFWDVSGVQRCTLCDKAISNDGDQQIAELVASGIITKVGE